MVRKADKSDIFRTPRKTPRKVKRAVVRKNGVVVKNPTTRRAWKMVEQRVAEFFGARRNPLSGVNSGHTASDSLHRKLFIEVKMKAKMPLYDLYIETAIKAKAEKKIPVVALQKKNHRGFLLLLEAENLTKISEYVANRPKGAAKD